VFDPSNEPSLPDGLEPVFRILGRWTSKPSAQEVFEFRALFPVLRNVPISTLLMQAMQRSDVELGRFTDSEMGVLAPTMQGLGFEITRTQIVLSNTGEID
jgi:hypothetical protein